MTAMTDGASYLFYKSDRYEVVAVDDGVVIKRADGVTRKYFGADARELQEGITTHRATSSPFEEIADRYLDQWMIGWMA